MNNKNNKLHSLSRNSNNSNNNKISTNKPNTRINNKIILSIYKILNRGLKKMIYREVILIIIFKWV